MTPLNVLISSGIWPPEIGGPASHGPEIGRFLVDRGHSVRAVTTSGPDGPEFPGFPITATRKDRHQLVRQPAAAARVMSATRGADVVYATGLYGRSSIASKALGVPLVVKLVNDPAYERARRLGLFSGSLEAFQRPSATKAERLLKALRRAILSRASTIVIPSHYLAGIASGWGLPGSRMRVVPNPAPDIDERVSREALRERLGIRGPTFVFAGRLTAQKNLPLAVAALHGVEGRFAGGDRRRLLGWRAARGDQRARGRGPGRDDRRAAPKPSDRLGASGRRLGLAKRLGELSARSRRIAGSRNPGGRDRGRRRARDRRERRERDPDAAWRPRCPPPRPVCACRPTTSFGRGSRWARRPRKERYRKQDIYEQIEQELELAASSARRTRLDSSWAASR